jgi:hypothetical protein
MKWLKYSGCNITLKLNPFHWRIGFSRGSENDAWEVTTSYMIELMPITIRIWFDDGSW